ncbi:ribonuclease HII [Flavobacterium agricola]|uniref:Ribonuclease HII n=1 Tax=Flavobacterium agricola TaxID=2870839 RepID=A0ABY6LW57_9FLAO|nr:ribonuclease HII [Flavobacterium agricola]UYW00560.1 ribonuclease HII [Flavobacterium agricola]
MLLKKYTDYNYEAGADEAGRGCLAGPVTCCSLILPLHFSNNTLTDSKKLTNSVRQELRKIIEEEALTFKVIHIYPEEIDRINILNASIKGMQECTLNLNIKPDFLIVDGNKFKPIDGIPHQTIVKGDAKFMNIAAASILAKTHRDAYMDKIHKEYPMYNWKKNKGYPTKEHRAAIAKFGPSPYHRMSFKLLPDDEQLSLDI